MKLSAVQTVQFSPAYEKNILYTLIFLYLSEVQNVSKLNSQESK